MPDCTTGLAPSAALSCRPTRRGVPIAALLLLLTAVPRAVAEDPGAPPTADAATAVLGAPRSLKPQAEALVAAFAGAAAGRAPIRIEPAAAESGVACLVEGTCDALLLPRASAEGERRLVQHRRSMELVETPFAVGAVAVIVHKDNPIASLTLEQVGAVFQTRVNRWSELDVIITAPVQESVCVICQSLAARGQRALLAEDHTHAIARTLQRIIPSEDSGAPAVLRQLATRGDRLGNLLTTVGDSFEVRRRVADDPLAIGLVVWGAVESEGVRVVPIRANADSPALEPTEATVRDRSYPLAHFLYFCTAGEPEGTMSTLRAFAIAPHGDLKPSPLAGTFPITASKP